MTLIIGLYSRTLKYRNKFTKSKNAYYENMSKKYYENMSSDENAWKMWRILIKKKQESQFLHQIDISDSCFT